MEDIIFDFEEVYYCGYEGCDGEVDEEGDLCEFHQNELLEEEYEESENRRWQESEYRVNAMGR